MRRLFVSFLAAVTVASVAVGLAQTPDPGRSGVWVTGAGGGTGDITSVVAGAGMTGGGTEGDVTLNVIGTADKVTVSADAVTIASTYVGQTSITTLGTIGTGTWQATDVGVAYGGTGVSTLTDGGVLLGSGTGAITATAVLGDGVILIGDNSGDPATLDVGSSTAITILGTVATGVWNGTAVADAYVANDLTISGGTVNNSVIGGSVAAAATVTTLDTTGAVTFNDAGADVDFRVESDDNANMLVVDGGLDYVGIGTTPASLLHVSGTVAAAGTHMKGIQLLPTVNGATGGWEMYGVQINPTLVESSDGSNPHGNAVGLLVNPLMTNGTAVTTVASAVSISSFTAATGTVSATGLKIHPPASATNNYGLWLSNGASGLAGMNAAADDILVESNGGVGMTFAGGADQNGTIAFGDPDSNYQGVLLYDHSSSKMKFSTSGSVQMVIDLDGDVGIGTDAPSQLLTLIGADDVDVSLQLGTTSDTTGAQFAWDYDNGSVGKLVFGTQKANALVSIRSGDNGEAIAIDASQKVGIGTADMDGLVHIQSASAGSVSAHANADELVVEGSANSGITILAGATSTANVFFGDAGNSSEGAIYFINNATTASLNIQNEFGYVNLLPSGGGDTGVGVGTSVPDGMLHVHTATAGSVTAPAGSDDLVVENSANAGLTFLSPSGNYQQEISFGDVGDADSGRIRYDHNDNVMYLYTEGTERLRITSTGDFGFNTAAAPVAAFHFRDQGTTNPLFVLERQVNTNNDDLSPIRWVGGTSSSTTAGAAYGTIHFDIASNTAGANHGMFVVSVSDAGTMTPRLTVSNAGTMEIVNVVASGSVSKGSGSFRIDHPLKPETHNLVHSFAESPDTLLLYRGSATIVDGEATVALDDYIGMTTGTFDALVRDTQVWVSNDTGWEAVRGSVEDGVLVLESQDPTATDVLVNWLIAGERQDDHIKDTDWTDEDGNPILEPEKDAE